MFVRDSRNDFKLSKRSSKRLHEGSMKTKNKNDKLQKLKQNYRQNHFARNHFDSSECLIFDGENEISRELDINCNKSSRKNVIFRSRLLVYFEHTQKIILNTELIDCFHLRFNAL